MARPTPAALLLSTLLAAVLGAQNQAPSKLTAEQVTALAQQAFTTFRPTGLAVAVVQDGELLAECGFGERKQGAPVTPGTLFNIASCSKAFTAALMAQLVAEGKVGWDDRVQDRVPEFRLQDPWVSAHMTIADLLSHRCGLVTFAGDLLWYGSDYDDAEVLRRMERLPLVQRFRDQFGYQNLMYMVAGQVEQRLAGKSWEELVEERLMRPLGMVHSRACVQRLPAEAEIAIPHIDGVPVQDHVFAACKPAASIYASVHELTGWMRMLLDGGKWDGKQLLDQKALAELWRPHTAMGGAAGAGTGDFRAYGMGWFLDLENGKKRVEHDGGMPGFLSKVSLLPADKFAFVVLNNGNDGAVNEALKRALYLAHRGQDGSKAIEQIGRIVVQRTAQEKAAVAEREGKRLKDSKPSLELAAYAGRYEDRIYGPAEVKLEAGALSVVLLPSKSRLHGQLQPWHQDVFRCDFPDRFLPFALFRFELDQTGKVAGFRIDCPIADFDFGALDFRRVEPASGSR